MRLVLAGGGHGHVHTLKMIRDMGFPADVLLISDKKRQYYSGMLSDYLSEIYTLEEVSFDLNRLAKKTGIRFVQDRIVKIDRNEKKVYGERSVYPYDILSMDLGTKTYPIGNNPTVKPLNQLGDLKRRLLEGKDPSTLLIVGGGASAFELGFAYRRIGEIYDRTINVNLVYDSEAIPDFPAGARSKIFDACRERGIGHIEDRAAAIEHRRLIGERGVYPFDEILQATGPEPVSIQFEGFRKNPEGYLITDEYLRVGPDEFAMGDMIDFMEKGLPKVGVYAIRQSPILWHNLNSRAKGRTMKPFKPQKDFLGIISLADGTAVAKYKGLFFSGHLIFKLKERIDRSFMESNKR